MGRGMFPGHRVKNQRRQQRKGQELTDTGSASEAADAVPNWRRHPQLPIRRLFIDHIRSQGPEFERQDTLAELYVGVLHVGLLDHPLKLLTQDVQGVVRFAVIPSIRVASMTLVFRGGSGGCERRGCRKRRGCRGRRGRRGCRKRRGCRGCRKRRGCRERGHGCAQSGCRAMRGTRGSVVRDGTNASPRAKMDGIAGHAGRQPGGGRRHRRGYLLAQRNEALPPGHAPEEPRRHLSSCPLVPHFQPAGRFRLVVYLLLFPLMTCTTT